MIYLENYLNYLKFELSLEENSILTYINVIKKFDEYLEEFNYELNEIKKENIYEFIDLYSSYSNNTLSLYISALKSYFNYLNDSKLFINDIFDNFITLKKEEKVIRTLSLDEINKLVEVSNNILDKLIVLILFKTGIRVSEFTNIKVNDLNLKEKNIKIHGKGNKERIVFFDKKIYDLLIIYLNSKKVNEFLFNIDRFYVYNRLNYLKNEAKIDKKIYPHILRHSFASYCLNNDMDLRMLQILLGHSDLKTTSMYTHLYLKELKESYKKYHPFMKGENSDEI